VCGVYVLFNRQPRFAVQTNNKYCAYVVLTMWIDMVLGILIFAMKIRWGFCTFGT